MDTKKLIQYCETNAARKWDTADALYKAKRYADSLFFCHLALEMALKGKVVVVTGDMFPLSHDLADLIKRTKFKLPRAHMRALAVINTFNIAGRYDDYKLSFYQKATRAYATRYFNATSKILLWLKEQ